MSNVTQLLNAIEVGDPTAADQLLPLDLQTLLEHRYAKYRAIGHYQERQGQILGHTNGDNGTSFSFSST